jgi:Cys-rich protein (TIGR01571 family)
MLDESSPVRRGRDDRTSPSRRVRKNSFSSPTEATQDRGLLRIASSRSNGARTGGTSRRSASIIQTPADAEFFDQLSCSTGVSLSKTKDKSPSAATASSTGSALVDHMMDNALHIMRSCSPVSDDDGSATMIPLEDCGRRFFGQQKEPHDNETRRPREHLDLRHNDDTFHVLASLLVEFFQAKVVGRTLVLMPDDRDTVARMLPSSAVRDFIDAVQYRLEMTPVVSVSPIQFLTLQCQELCLDRETETDNPILAALVLERDPITMQVLSVLADAYRYDMGDSGEDEDIAPKPYDVFTALQQSTEEASEANDQGFDLNTIPSDSTQSEESAIHVASSRDIQEEMLRDRYAEESETGHFESDPQTDDHGQASDPQQDVIPDEANDENMVFVQHSDTVDVDETDHEPGQEIVLQTSESVHEHKDVDTDKDEAGSDLVKQLEPDNMSTIGLDEDDNLARETLGGTEPLTLPLSEPEEARLLLEGSDKRALVEMSRREIDKYHIAIEDFQSEAIVAYKRDAAKAEETSETNNDRDAIELRRSETEDAAALQEVHAPMGTLSTHSTTPATDSSGSDAKGLDMTTDIANDGSSQKCDKSPSSQTQKRVNRGARSETMQSGEPDTTDIMELERGTVVRDVYTRPTGTNEEPKKFPREASYAVSDPKAPPAANPDTTVVKRQKKTKKSGSDSVTRRMQAAADSFFAELRSAVDAQVSTLQGNLMEAIKAKTQPVDDDATTQATSVAIRNDATVLSCAESVQPIDKNLSLVATGSLWSGSATQREDLPPEISITSPPPAEQESRQEGVGSFFGTLVAGLIPPVVEGISVNAMITAQVEEAAQVANSIRDPSMDHQRAQENAVSQPEKKITATQFGETSIAKVPNEQPLESPTDDKTMPFHDVPVNENVAADDTAKQQLVVELNEARQLMEHSVTEETTRFWRDHVDTLQSRIDALSSDPSPSPPTHHGETPKAALHPANADPKSSQSSFAANPPSHVQQEQVYNDGYYPMDAFGRSAQPAGSSLEDYQIPKVDVVAPADLPGGYHFEAEIEGVRFLATVPPGGVQQGETFTCLMRELDSVAIDIPVGYWKDGLCNVCELGWYHPVAWLSIFCPLITLGQIQTRINLDFLGRPRFGEQQISTRSMMLSLIIFWGLTNIGLFAACNLKWSRGLELSVGDALAVALANIVMFGFTVFVTQSTRSSLREKFLIREERCFDLEDICYATLCLPCTVSQMARHTANYDDYEAVCCSKTGLPNGVRVNRASPAETEGYAAVV